MPASCVVALAERRVAELGSVARDVRVPLEHVSVELDRRVVVTGVQLEPVRRAGLAEDAEALVETGLPDADRGLPHVGHDGHPAQLHHVHGRDDHATAVRDRGIDGRRRVVGGEVHGPDIGHTGLPVVLHAAGDRNVRP